VNVFGGGGCAAGGGERDSRWRKVVWMQSGIENEARRRGRCGRIVVIEELAFGWSIGGELES